jgi:hypothetical protein
MRARARTGEGTRVAPRRALGPYAGGVPGARPALRLGSAAGLALTLRMGTAVSLALTLAVAALLATASVALAADPTASPAGAGDVRTNPATPGLAGDPLFAVLGVALVGVAAGVVTLVAVRLTARP